MALTKNVEGETRAATSKALRKCMAEGSGIKIASANDKDNSKKEERRFVLGSRIDRLMKTSVQGSRLKAERNERKTEEKGQRHVI